MDLGELILAGGALILGICLGILIAVNNFNVEEYDSMLTHCELHLNGQQGHCILQAMPVITYGNQGIPK